MRTGLFAFVFIALNQSRVLEKVTLKLTEFKMFNNLMQVKSLPSKTGHIFLFQMIRKIMKRTQEQFSDIFEFFRLAQFPF